MESRSISLDSDLPTMHALARQFPAQHLRMLDLPYRLCSWALDEPQNTRLWFDDAQRLVGWVVLQPPFWTVDFAVHPAVELELFPAMIAWADERAAALVGTPFGLPSWFYNIFADQKKHIAALESAGYTSQSDKGEDSWSKVFMRRSTFDPVKVYQPPPGFTVRPLAGEAEAQAYVDLHQAVFGTKNMMLAWRQRTLRHPAYRPDLDLVVAAPDGRLGAFCVCWYDEAAQAGQVEPLGCHADFRRYALGRVALSHGLARLQALGARSIFVETDNYRDTAYRLYQSFGFEVIREVLVFGKEF